MDVSNANEHSMDCPENNHHPETLPKSIKTFFICLYVGWMHIGNIACAVELVAFRKTKLTFTLMIIPTFHRLFTVDQTTIVVIAIISLCQRKQHELAVFQTFFKVKKIVYSSFRRPFCIRVLFPAFFYWPRHATLHHSNLLFSNQYLLTRNLLIYGFLM